MWTGTEAHQAPQHRCVPTQKWALELMLTPSGALTLGPLLSGTRHAPAEQRLSLGSFWTVSLPGIHFLLSAKAVSF